MGDYSKAARAGRESDVFLSLLLEQMPAILWSVDAELRFTSSLGAALATLNLSPNQVLGTSLFEYFGTDDPDFVPIAAHLKALQGQESSYEFSWEDRTFRCHVEPLRDPHGEILGALGVAFDVTPGKRAEDALKVSERRYRRLFEDSRDAIYVSSTDGVLLEFNRSMLEMFGYSPEEMRELNAEVLYLHREDRKRFQEAIESQGSVQDFEVQLVTKDGRVMHCLLSSSLQHGEDGEVIGYQGIIHDITQRKIAEETLRKEKEFSDAALESLPGLFYLFDERGRFLRWNRNLEWVTGYTAADLSVMQPLDIVAPADRPRLERCMADVFSKGSSSSEADLLKEDGSTTPYFFTGTLIEIAGRPCVVGMAMDLESQRRLEEQLRQSQKMEAIGQLAGGVAHDFNNILTVILSNADILLSALGPEDPRREELEGIREASQRAASLTRQLLAFSRKQMLRPKIVNLNSAIVNLENMLRRLIGEDIELITLLDPALWLVEADPGQIEQVVMNLAVNARDAMPRGGKLVIETGNLEVDEEFADSHYAVVPGCYVTLLVSDNGVGMTAETRERIFEPFFTTKQRSKGTGLGLSTVYGIVKQSGGFIWAHSDFGKGTTFKVYLPRADDTAATPQRPARWAAAPQGSETVLLVEDEDSVRELARRILVDRGYRVLEAADATQALEVSRVHPEPIHLLLTDVVMPGLNGRELADRLRPQRPGMEVLYMSGYSDHAVLRDRTLNSGTNFLHKPFTPESLARRVRDVLDLRRPAGR